MATSSLREKFSYNYSMFRHQPWAEISGSLGDLGTFLPIVIALSEGEQISLSTTLILTGVFNILTGLFFGIPLPVQPMKAIAAIAISRHLSAGQTAAAGIFVSVCILVLSLSGLLKWLTRVIPIPVVKGIQVGAGLSLLIAAGGKAKSVLTWLGPSWTDNYFWIVAAFLGLILMNLHPRTPYALLLTVFGVTLAIIALVASPSEGLPSLRLWHPYTKIPQGTDWKTGILNAGIGQLPLTTLNSIIAVTHLAADILPEVTTPSVTSIGISVAAMNLCGCWFGAMPVCHGSGGLAAQYRFGARSGASIIFLGTLKLVIGLAFGESLTDLLHRFPTALLTVMIVAAGLELASVGESLNTNRARDLKENMNSVDLTEVEKKQRWTTMLVTAGLLIAFKNDAIGFLAGLLWHWSYSIPGSRTRFGLSRDGNQSQEEEESLLA